MAELICPKADDCPLNEMCWHAEYHDPDPEGWRCRSTPGVNGCPACITMEEAELIKEITDAEDKGFIREVNDGKL